MMKKIILLFLTIMLALTLLSFPGKTEAIVTKPFGGRVVINFVPGVVCPGPPPAGPITIVPSGVSAPSPYAVTPGTIRHQFYVPKTGGWILGLHAVVAPVCYIPSPFGPIPFPALPIVRFGSSRF